MLLFFSFVLFFFTNLERLRCLDYHMDPATVIATLAKMNMTTMESVLTSMFLFLTNLTTLNFFFPMCFFVYFNLKRQMPDDMFAKMKEIINAADNVTIAPCFVVEGVSFIGFFSFFFSFFFYSEFFFFTLPET